MWDDTALGEIGIPEIQKVRGFETPNINQFAAEGINFMRMYTEPSCTPSRAAVMTGRNARRNGMYNVGFPYEYGGLADDEVTIAEVVGQAGYATAFFGKAHLGDVESSYLNQQGFDEALWTPYNQVPSLYVPRGQIGVLQAGILNPEFYPEDPYETDPEWRVKGYVWALEGKKGGPVREWGTPRMKPTTVRSTVSPSDARWRSSRRASRPRSRSMFPIGHSWPVSWGWTIRTKTSVPIPAPFSRKAWCESTTSLAFWRKSWKRLG